MMLVSCTRSASHPVYDISELDEIEIGQVMGAMVDRLQMPRHLREEHKGNALARWFRTLNPEELSSIQPPSPLNDARLFNAHRQMYFDLWTAMEHLSKDTSDRAIQLEFTINSKTPSTCFLGIGANDCVLVWNDKLPIFGVTGWRENKYTHHVVPVVLKSGQNRIRLLLQKNQTWDKIPVDHLTDEWATNLQLFRTKEVARRRHGQRVAHPFDASVLKSLEDLRIDGYSDGSQEIEVFNTSGERIAFGRALATGSIRWEQKDTTIEYPFIGLAVIKNEIGEPIVVCGPSGIDSGLEVLRIRANDLKGPWGYRLRHLLKTQFASGRDSPWNTWGQKLAISAFKSFSTDPSPNADPYCPSLAVEFGTFTSSIDGTTQYYRYYRSPGVVGARTLSVIVPTAPAEMRPYLELVADLQNTERTAGLAQANGLDVLWVGGVSPDYGGRVARQEVRESINAYLTAFPPDPNDRAFLVAPCSAAVTALGLISERLPVDGAVLWTPVVRRWRDRWAREESPLPPVVATAEQTDMNFEAIKDCPILLYWDSDAPGHGDKTGSVTFHANSIANGCLVEAMWVAPLETTTLWGPREAMSIQEWMTWVKRSRSSARHDAAALMRLPRSNTPGTVKEALLQGFTLSASARQSSYFAMWQDQLTAYRGERATLQSSANEMATQVSEVQLANADLITHLRTSSGLDPDLVDGETHRTLLARPFWGFHLANGSKPTVEILSSPGVGMMPPAIDLLIDGSCKGAIWTLHDGQWKLTHVWL